MSINDKIKQVLTIKNLSPSYLADDIGVQRSSISHILSGRNRPSLDIIQKIVRRFPEFTYEWFLDSDLQLSTDDHHTEVPQITTVTRAPRQPIANSSSSSSVTIPAISEDISTTDDSKTTIPKQDILAKHTIDRILIFYTDGTFKEYTPAL
jgi:transcriptional regulator with XRE-family HTH domain